MNNKTHSEKETKGLKWTGAGLLVAFSASLCCITPVLSLLSGIGGVATTFSWMEPFRPFLIGMTVVVLAFAWYQKLKPRKAEEVECACDEEEKTPFIQKKVFLGIVTIVSALLLSFPSYSYIFYNTKPKTTSEFPVKQLSQLNLDIEGMTCTSCEDHIEHASNQLDGVLSTAASYEKGTASITFDPSTTSEKAIEQAINATGYKVVNANVSTSNQELDGRQKSTQLTELELSVKGMTCSGCEAHVNHAVSQLDGIIESKTSYEGKSATITFDSNKTSKEAIIKAVNSTGYKVVTAQDKQ